MGDILPPFTIIMRETHTTAYYRNKVDSPRYDQTTTDCGQHKQYSIFDSPY